MRTPCSRETQPYRLTFPATEVGRSFPVYRHANGVANKPVGIVTTQFGNFLSLFVEHLDAKKTPASRDVKRIFGRLGRSLLLQIDRLISDGGTTEYIGQRGPNRIRACDW